jgi:hypothetical protein
MPPAADFQPRLYDLETDVGETADVATTASSQIGPKVVDPENADAPAEPAGDPSADSC